MNLLYQVESVGEGVTSVAVGDHVIPLYTAGEISEIVVPRDSLNSRQNAGSASSAKAARPISAAKVYTRFFRSAIGSDATTA